MSNEFIKQHSDIWREKPSDLLSEYKYQPKLTEKLDAIHTNKTGIDRQTLYEIVLWKTNRFPEIDDHLIADLRSLATLGQGQHECECAKNILERLLRTNGIALPMASTILRFANPKTFQIIDDRAYRVIFPGEKKYPSKPANCSNYYLRNSIDIYFRYLNKLIEVCCNEVLPFEFADRILYQLDIKRENKIGDKS